MAQLELYGCRHDVLGHYLKAIGLLRAIAQCAEPEHRDPEVEGWWDLGRACFCLRSEKYPTMEKLVEFFKERYRPTPVFSAWNKEVGGTAKLATALSLQPERDLAVAYASEVVSVADRKKPANSSKKTAAEAFADYRDDNRHNLAEVLDAVAAPRFYRRGDNPVFLAKGVAGRAHVWRSYWGFLARYRRLRATSNKLAFAAFLAGTLEGYGEAKPAKGKGSPFFSDAIKTYNFGSGWVEESHPFFALDYVLAVEGAFALRGSVARATGARARRFAAFPFVFDSGEDLVDDENKITGTAAAVWLPLWDRPTSYGELASFISDAQARLPGKDARFSAEFVRALYGQGVDAGFPGWQEFRFKMKGSRVQWITTGRYVAAASGGRAEVTRLNLGLAPLDEACFLDQFEVAWKGGKVESSSPHPVRRAINAAMETAAVEPTPGNCLALLQEIFSSCAKICVSEKFRKKLRGGHPVFFAPLPMEAWDELLGPLESLPEFWIARALASVTGLKPPTEGAEWVVQPMLGSILPLRRRRWSWNLPEKNGDHTHQDVWTGSDLCHDLAAVLRRRYLDSAKDELPALQAVHGAKLADILQFLRGELDDGLIARWTEALSLIGWHRVKRTGHGPVAPSASSETESPECIEPAYAALRGLLELECEYQGEDRAQWKKRRSLQPVALLCERSAASLPTAVGEALRWASIWGVPNHWSASDRIERPRLGGRFVLRVPEVGLSSAGWAPVLVERLAAAVCIPLRWHDREQLYRAITIPPGK